MKWWRKKMSQDVVKKERFARGEKRGEILLEELIECCDGKSNPIMFFSADEIIKATENICNCNIQERCPNFCECSRVYELWDHGSWYSGMLDNRRMIYISEMINGNPDYPRKLCRDVAISSMVSGHKNFMKLVGCCFEFEYPVMVYYCSEKHYSALNLIILSWEKRMNIAEEIATALSYLHTAFPRPFVYRNMNLRNILLDDDGVAKLSDFSNCVSIPEGETFVKLDSGGGDYDYMDDNYLNNGVVSEKTDAFGFGIFMQKLLTGEERFRELYPWNDLSDWESTDKRFPKWLSKYKGEGRMDEIIDPKVLEEMGEVAEKEQCRMEAFLVLSERCIGLRGEVPKMVEVAKEIKRSLKNTCSSFPSGETH